MLSAKCQPLCLSLNVLMVLLLCEHDKGILFFYATQKDSNYLFNVNVEKLQKISCTAMISADMLRIKYKDHSLSQVVCSLVSPLQHLVQTGVNQHVFLAYKSYGEKLEAKMK